MKKLSFALVLLSASLAFGQTSDRRSVATLSSTCSNATTTCDTANVTIFGPTGDVLGPQTVEVNTQNYGLAQITIHGTYTGSTVNFEYSDDGGTTWYPEICARSDANIQESSEAVGSNAAQGWECSIGAATRFRVRQSALTTGSPIVTITETAGLVEPAPTVATVGSSAQGATVSGGPVMVGIQDNSGFAQYVIAASRTSDGATASGTASTSASLYNGATYDRQRSGAAANLPSLTGSLLVAPVTVDPCGSPAVLKSSKVINITSTTAVALVGAVAAKNVFICGGALTIQGSATTVGTVQFESGTQTTNPCDTSTTLLTGTFAGNINASVPTVITLGGSTGTQFSTAAVNQQLCAVATGTTISIQGYVNFVQQ